MSPAQVAESAAAPGGGFPRHETIVHAFAAAVRERSTGVALVCRERSLTYAELGRAAAGLAAELGESASGRRVAVLLPNGIEAVVSVLGVLAAGAQVAPINPFFTRPELAVVLAEARPDVVICGPEARDKMRSLSAELGLPDALVFDAGPGDLDVARWLADERWSLEQRPRPRPDDLALLIFTGGTTGEPKGVEHRHRSLTASLLQHCSVWPVRWGEERFASVAPIFHVWGLSYATLVPIYTQGTLVIVPRYEAGEVLEALERQRVTVFGGGPAPVYLGLMQSPRFASTDFSSMKYCLSGGAPCPEELHREWERHTGCALLEGWGMSEAAPLCLNRPNSLRKLLSVGRAVPDTEVEVVDLETGTRALPANEAGEVRVRGPQLMQGYRGRPEATRDVLRDGWLYTGDIGYLDADGYLFLVDRKKDMIIVGGYNVYPRQVDEVLFKHPSIAEAATVGRPDPLLGEVLVAFVVRRSGAELTEEGFFDYCRENLVKYRRPVAVTFVETLPRTNARKLDKKALRALASG